MSHTTLKTCAALLVTGFLVLGFADNLRPWRRLQVEFYSLERAGLETRLAAERRRLEPRLAKVEEAVAEERRRLAEQESEWRRLEDRLRVLGGKEERARMRLEEARSALLAAQRSSADRATIEPLDSELREARREFEAWQEELAEQERVRDRLGAGLAMEESREAEIHAELEPFEERLSELQRGAVRRSLPLLGLFGPLVAPQAVTLGDLPLPAPHVGAPRVDRCVTCHLGAPRPGFDTFPAPFASHPRFDLFVSEGSAHPYSEVGCTICHGGEGRATAFDRAGHVPRDGAQEAVWKERWGYRAGRLPPRPILPSSLQEVGCAACHRAGRNLPTASTLETGRRLGQRLGCGACHPALMEDPTLPKQGPSLRRLAAKTRPSWVARFLEDPSACRPTTWMPHGLNPSGAGPDQPARRVVEISAVEINALVTYLFEHSQVTDLEPRPRGDAEVGGVLFERVGCTACHVLDAETSRDAHAPGFTRLQGPNLARMGNKAEGDWLYAWLRDPQADNPQTPMPNLRLDTKESAALTAFLLSQQDSGWESTWQARELPAVDSVIRDRLVLEHLEQQFSLRESAVRFEAMEENERTLYLGERVLAQHGCHGCHAIPGFEDTPSPNVPLPHLTTQRALSWIDDLDSAFPHRSAPQAGAVGRASPQYDLNLGERTALATWLLSSQVPRAPVQQRLEAGPALIQGQRLVERYGCRGCHPMLGHEGIIDSQEQSGEAAPALRNEGRRVRPSWLLAFLREPGKHPVRPWLEVRMPRFALSDQQFITLTEYFIERDGASLLEVPAPRASATERAVGAVYFNLLQCARCHFGREESGGLQVPQFAPSYQLASQRLREPWVEEWILNPTRYDPHTSMPALVGDDSDSSFLLRSLNAPMFIGQKARLERALKDQDALADFLEDPERVAQALRVHLWSLGEQERVR